MDFFKRNPVTEDDAVPENGSFIDGKTDEPLEDKNILKLKFPIMVDNEAVLELRYDFDALRAKDLHEISKQLKNKGIFVSMPAFDFDYQIFTFAKAVTKVNSNIFLTDILRLSGSDCIKATGLARDFLLDSDPSQKDLTSGD